MIYQVIFIKYVVIFPDIPRATYNLIANPIYLVTCFGICCEIIIVSGFIVFLPKFLETQFGMTKSVANLLTGKKYIFIFTNTATC